MRLLLLVLLTPFASAEPLLFFSDLDWGPKTGFDGSSTKGAAVTVWGLDFGSTRGSNYITINGIDLTSDSDYAEWGVVGPARNLERITFWVPSTASDGLGEITVTVSGETSNALPFTVMDGVIYFVSPDGSDSNDGLRSVNAGVSGPFRNIYMFNPDVTGHSRGTNPSGDGQYIMYVREGTYATLDVDSTFLALRGPSGGSDKRKALIAYPGETPILDASSATRGVSWNAKYDPYGRNEYYTFSKLTVIDGWGAFESWGDYNRFIGNHFEDMLNDIWSGVIMVDNSQYTKVYGNYFEHNGYDSFKHNVYTKTHQNYVDGDTPSQFVYIGWNEFDRATASDGHGGVVFLSTATAGANEGKNTNNIHIHDNYFHDGNMDYISVGDASQDVSDVYIYNNIMTSHDGTDGGFMFRKDAKNIQVYNNVFYQVGAASSAMLFVTGETDVTFKNNIWYARPGQEFLDLETFLGATFTSDSDIFFSPSGAAPPSGFGMTVTNALTLDPLFENVGVDFYLQEGSPAIDSGVDVALLWDYIGVSRPQNQYDRGAYEFTGATACSHGSSRMCSTGNLGICSSGTQTCNGGAWGVCVQDNNPVTEQCGNNLDDDCDGLTDEGCSGIRGDFDGDNDVDIDDFILITYGGTVGDLTNDNVVTLIDLALFGSLLHGPAGVCSHGLITNPCLCGGVERSTDYCCNDNWQSQACGDEQCADGLITEPCLCGGVTRHNSYCCSDNWQSSPC